MASKDNPPENIFRIMDEIVRQLNRTKKMFILMVVSTIVIVPAIHLITVALGGDPFQENEEFQRDGPPFRGAPPANPVVPAIVVGIVIAWIVIGVRQWFVLSKWTKKYNQYKELQKKIDEKLDYDDEEKEGQK